ncbi:carboxyl transferase domain-containing protein [Bailinhaonella thermotolerans]|uniref:Biotin carboxylase n=1 Tax=Bailinhaonella thermotolerans TaxID=1070861 RepID=A0A3A4BEG9_9ACTN|nr:carboxyl transferase domain-containing protein [Bailinhaonella thermotolerans]RJL32710.1 hypothetical protein D5H75_14595 [Bailinhaonella thermotolerans]
MTAAHGRRPARAGEGEVRAELAGTVVEIAEPGARVAAGGELAVLESMKMEHAVTAAGPVVVIRAARKAGDTVAAGDLLLVTAPADADGHVRPEAAAAEAPGARGVRADLAEVLERHRVTTDAARPEAMAKLRARGRRSARENLADLVDEGSLAEYAPLAIAAQRRRRPLAELIAQTPADGLVGGLATVNGHETVVMSYDYTVLAGTQGYVNHAKTDRLIALAARRRVPLVIFPEGGGGRPGDTDHPVTAGLSVPTFRELAALRGTVPLVAVVSGRCFAGNAALAGTCDVIIATPDANLGMGGPAMIEGGGLGVVRPEEIGPADVQTRNGVIDVLAADEAEAVALARRYLSYFQGPRDGWRAPDAARARDVVPENRLRAYDVHDAIDAIFDVGSVLELRPRYGPGVVTALARVEGRPCGVIANNALHLGGAIDAEAAQKAREFLRIVGDFGLPLVSLCDTPGFMVGPAAEEQASVRRFAELFAAGAALPSRTGVIVLRKAYGLGAMAMATGSFRAPDFTVSWPTGEFGGMGLEGAVKLGFRRELDAEPDPARRRELYDGLLAAAYEQGRALNAASAFEIDDVIDPADSRRWISRLFAPESR